MNMKNRILWIGVVCIVIVATGIFCNREKHDNTGSSKMDAENTKAAKKETNSNCFKGAISVIKTWEMPEKLTEISGMAWVDKDRVAAIEDNDGIIFIYNLKDEKIETKIKF